LARIIWFVCTVVLFLKVMHDEGAGLKNPRMDDLDTTRLMTGRVLQIAMCVSRRYFFRSCFSRDQLYSEKNNKIS
jgi:uncharacterized membrane protein AbrB (regulator of aidB expression)